MITNIDSIASKEVFRVFQEYNDRKFIFVEPGGNHGDYLIYRGAQKLAKIAGINYQTVTNKEFMESEYSSDSVVYIHGGGGYVPCWSGAPQVFKKAVATHSGVTIVGPTTFSEDVVFLKSLLEGAFKNIISKKLIIFVRESRSFKTLESLIPSKVELFLDHDTAFNLKRNDIIKIMPHKRYTLYAIRNDKEAVNSAERNFLAVWCDPAGLRHFNFKQWVFLHTRAKKIITNRCHSAILGAILDIPVIMLPNSYHKNRSIWEYSLAKHGVKWSNDIPISKISNSINFLYPLRKIVDSYICQSALKLYYGTRYRDLYSPLIESYVL